MQQLSQKRDNDDTVAESRTKLLRGGSVNPCRRKGPNTHRCRLYTGSPFCGQHGTPASAPNCPLA
jgi:hypothetical protein